MDRFAALTGRQYRLFEYVGAPDAERVIVLMGSGLGAAEETVRASDRARRQGRPAQGAPVPALRPRAPARRPARHGDPPIAVLDRTKEPGADGEPLYKDVLTALAAGRSPQGRSWRAMPRVVGGRYGLSSKEFTPAMVLGIFDELAKDRPPAPLHRRHHRRCRPHLAWTGTRPSAPTRAQGVTRLRLLWPGLGRHRVGQQELHQDHRRGDRPTAGQGYFQYDSKKAGAVTISHLRFGPKPIRFGLSDRRWRGQLRRLPSADLPETLRHAGQGRTGRRSSCSTPPTPPERVWDESAAAACSSR